MKEHRLTPSPYIIPIKVSAIDVSAEIELRARIEEILSSREYSISYTLVCHELAICAEELPEVFKLVDELRARIESLESGDSS